MKNEILISISRFMFPFIVALGFYVQINGNNAPGGGFQSGVIIASAFILFCLVFGSNHAEKIISKRQLKFLSVVGVFLYGLTGLVSVFMGGDFLNYTLLQNKFFDKQTLGIAAIEWGVGITVFSVFSLIYLIFDTRGST